MSHVHLKRKAEDPEPADDHDDDRDAYDDTLETVGTANLRAAIRREALQLIKRVGHTLQNKPIVSVIVGIESREHGRALFAGGHGIETSSTKANERRMVHSAGSDCYFLYMLTFNFPACIDRWHTSLDPEVDVLVVVMHGARG